MSTYKRLLRFIPIFAVLVILPRVADFVGLLGPENLINGVIRYAFAALLGLGVVATSYFADDTPAPLYDDDPPNARERRRREREAEFYAASQEAAPHARRALYMFAGLDGTFNLADALMGASANGLFGPENGLLAYVYMLATVLYGLSPTILVVTVTRVVAKVDRIPAGEKSSRARIDWGRTIATRLGLQIHGEATEHRTTEQPRRTEQVGRTEQADRTPGDQGARVVAYLTQHATANHTPGVTEIRDALDEPKPSKSTISVVRRNWINNFNPWRAEA